MMIEFIVTEKKWRHHFLHYKSMGKNFHTQGRITAKWKIRSGPNSNLFELLRLSSLPASLTKIQSKVTEKSGRHHFFFHCSRACNSKWLVRYDQNSNWPEILCLSSLPVSLMKTEFVVKNGETIFPIKSQWERSRANNSIVKSPTQPKFEHIWEFMPVLVTCKFDKDLVKGDWENVGTTFFSLYVNESFLLPW